MGSERIAKSLDLSGIQLSERAVRNYLAMADELGWTENLGRGGRRLTPRGIEELEGALVADKVGFIAGMRAAMQGLIARFDPSVLETRLTRKSVLDAMLPGSRKARLWELFGELYAEISREAEDDFEALFGREFVKAYEQQVARLDPDKN